MLKDLKEISDGEIKVAISTVYMTLEVRGNENSIVGKQPYCIQRQFFNKDFEPVILSRLYMSRILSDLINSERSSTCL